MLTQTAVILNIFTTGQLVHVCISIRSRRGLLEHRCYRYKIFKDFPYFEIPSYIFELNMSVLQ